MMTNRDIYLLVCGFAEKYKDDKLPSLEAYLRSLWLIVSQSKVEDLTIEQVVRWLEEAFTTTPPAFDDKWLNIERDYSEDLDSKDGWNNIILFQIADLRRMRDAGQLDNEYKYLGIESPTGNSWFNFDPLSYLECGIVGSMAGYQEEEYAIRKIETFTWQDFIAILESGQWYE